jgi:hypothetical protein
MQALFFAVLSSFGFAKVLTYLPVAGLVGYAVYQVSTQNYEGAYQSLAQAAGLAGIGSAVHATAAAVAAPTNANPVSK